MNKTPNFICPYCNRRYANLEDMYSCAKQDEQINQQRQTHLFNQAKEYYKVIETKIKECNEAIDKYNNIIIQCDEGKMITHCMINTQKIIETKKEKEIKKPDKEEKKVIKDDEDKDTFMNLEDFLRYICELEE